MGSKGRIPPPHLRYSLSGPGMMHPDPFSSPPVRPSPGGYSHFDALPPLDVMEHKLAGQHVEMQKLLTENQRLASTHGTLRNELATAQNELQLLHSHIGSLKSEGEQQTRSLVDKMGKMETDLNAAESIKMDIEKARAEAQSLYTARQDLISKVQHLNHDLEKTGSGLQQMPHMFSELEALRQEYQQCRTTHEYEKKLYNDHVEHLQAMERNYMTMATEVEKLKEKLANDANLDRIAGSTYGAAVGFNENNASGSNPGGQNAYSVGYTTAQVVNSLPGGVSAGASAAYPVQNRGASIGAGITQTGTQPGPSSATYAKGPGPNAQRGPVVSSYDAQRGAIAPSWGPSYNPPGPFVPGYEMQNPQGPFAPGYEMQMVHGSYDMHRGHRYDASSGGTPVFQGQVPVTAPYGSATQQIRPATGH